jgi:ACR3 family arsenite transporter
MVIGVLLGNFIESTGPALQKGKFVGVSIPIAIGLLVMMYPILCKVKYETLHHLFKKKALWVQIGFSIVMNWNIAPFLMVSCSAKPLYQCNLLINTEARTLMGLSPGPFRTP